jgi:hypothetical protein
VQPRNTGVALVDWGDEEATVQFPAGRGNEDLLELLIGDDFECVGIDVPLGWPVNFVDVVRRHEAQEPLRLSQDWEGDYSGFRLRDTDRWVRQELLAREIKQSA